MFNKILLPVDLEDMATTERLLGEAEKFAVSHKADLYVLTVVPPFAMSIVGSFFPEDHEEKALENAGHALKSMLDKRSSKAKVTAIVAGGTIYDEIMRQANEQECDLIMLGDHRANNHDYLLGPNAARVVRHAKQSVFVMRPGK